MNVIKSTLLSLSSSRILRQAGWLAAAKIVQGVASVAATLAIARHLGPSVFGELSLAIATASFVASAAALGLEHIATRELVIDSDGRGTRQAFVTLRRLRLAGAGMGMLLLLLFSQAGLAQAYGVSTLLLILCLLPLAQIGDVSEWRLIATERSRQVAFVVMAISPIAALVRLKLAFEGADVSLFAWALVLEWAMRSIALTIISRNLPHGPGETAAEFLPSAIALLRDSMPLLLAGMAVFVYMRIDQFMIAAILGTRQVGLYSAVVSLAEIPLVLPTLLLRAALPVLAKQSATDPKHGNRTLASLMRNGFYIHAAMAVVLAIFAEQIVVLLYGESFRPAASAFRIQVMSAPFVALGVLSSAWLVVHRCTGHALRRTVVGAISNVALNFLLVPAYGITGAAIATLVAQLIATLAADIVFRQTRELFWIKIHALLPFLPQGAADRLP